MKIAKKLSIIALAISPLTSLAFVPNNVRQEKLVNHSFYLVNSKKDCKEYVKCVEELIKEFDLFVDAEYFTELPFIIERKRKKINEEIENYNKHILYKNKEYKEVNKEYLDGFKKRDNFDINEYLSCVEVKGYEKFVGKYHPIWGSLLSGNNFPKWKWLIEDDFKNVPYVETRKGVMPYSNIDKRELDRLSEKVRIKLIIESNNKYMLEKLERIKTDIELSKVAIGYLNNKLKLLEKIENDLLVIELKLDYKESMRKYYSSEALQNLIYEIEEKEQNLKDLYLKLITAIKNGQSDWEKSLREIIKSIEKETIDLVDYKKMLEKHFKV